MFDDKIAGGARSDLKDGVLIIGSHMEHQWDGVMRDKLSRFVWVILNRKMGWTNLT